MTMTLQETHDWLVEVCRRNAVNASLDDLDDHDAEAVIQALDAHLAAMKKPVAWRITDGEGGFNYLEQPLGKFSISWAERWGRAYEPLYSVPPASGDWDKVREMIVMMRTSQISRPDWADKLTAALPESQP